jgi:hypothetical protein
MAVMSNGPKIELYSPLKSLTDLSEYLFIARRCLFKKTALRLGTMRIDRDIIDSGNPDSTRAHWQQNSGLSVRGSTCLPNGARVV